MKLIVTYKNALVDNQRLFPRDIRNYIGSISSETDKEFTMWHKNEAPIIIYSQPNRNGFALISYKRDEETKQLFQRILKSILDNKKISFQKENINTEVKEAFIIEYDYTNFKNEMCERTLRTPMLMTQYARARQLSSGELNGEKLEKLVIDTIRESIAYTCRSWFGKELDILDELIIMCKDLKYFPMKYKDGQYYPAVLGTFVANKKLPDYIGYKIGMGYGELMRPKEAKRRGSRNDAV